MFRNLACFIVTLSGVAIPMTVNAGIRTTFECRLERACDAEECLEPAVYTLTSSPQMVPGKKVADQAEPATLTGPDRTIAGRAFHTRETVFWNNRVRNEVFESSVLPELQEYIVLNINDTGLAVLTIVDLSTRETSLLMGQCLKLDDGPTTG